MKARRNCKCRLIVGVGLVALGLLGCQSTQRQASTPPTPTPAGENPRIEDAIAGSDAQRAEAALERHRSRGERRPVVDQTRLPRR